MKNWDQFLSITILLHLTILFVFCFLFIIHYTLFIFHYSMIHILCISDSHKHFTDAIHEYIKRLEKTVCITCVKPSRKDDATSVIREESALLLDKVQKMPQPWILLEKDGKQVSSEEFAVFLQKNNHSCTFILWWPFGVDVSVFANLWIRIISWGKHTMPHGLALLVLLEQLYRGQSINEWKKYHY